MNCTDVTSTFFMLSLGTSSTGATQVNVMAAGVPYHVTGPFPNPLNPNVVCAQMVSAAPAGCKLLLFFLFALPVLSPHTLTVALLPLFRDGELEVGQVGSQTLRCPLVSLENNHTTY